ncbi:hypothetical protein FNH22_26445 [Fulvivirga sp. M361]|uniref:hypothetical protein n=1 Tax=Fulvivirga sp. M361 TaxID=2594266 RepID=UPI001179F8C6|nr:hypothetical protein [Fulvivirga sp. M361]TRX49847.1 hypothetical protein FNH22_26445 [Fulvivirga sp. M361]
MKSLAIEQMQNVVGGGEWVWRPNLSNIPISMGDTCQDVYNYYGGNASYAASQLSGTYVLSICMMYVGGGGGE